MAQIMDIKINWNHTDILTAPMGTLNGNELSIEHPKWVLPESTARSWTVGNAPACKVTGHEVKLGDQDKIKIGHHQDTSYSADMKLKTFGGKTGKCVFKK